MAGNPPEVGNKQDNGREGGERERESVGGDKSREAVIKWRREWASSTYWFGTKYSLADKRGTIVRYSYGYVCVTYMWRGQSGILYIEYYTDEGDYYVTHYVTVEQM